MVSSVTHLSKMFKLLILTIGFNSCKVIDELSLSSIEGLVRTDDCKHGLKRRKDRLENVYSILFETRQGKIMYLFIEAREKTDLKLGDCKCELF